MLPASHCNCAIHNRHFCSQKYHFKTSRSLQLCRNVASAAAVESTAADSWEQVSSLQPETHSSSSDCLPRKYLTFDQYVALQQQYKERQALIQQQAAAGAGNTEATKAAPQPFDGSDEAQDGPKKRVPWNKGRKHSALTIARIVAGNERARERPEVKARYEAWRQSRVGVPLPDDIREKIRQGGLDARMRRLQNTTQVELEARRAEISERSKKLWQDPEYAEKTKQALRAALRRRRSKTSSSSEEEETTTQKPQTPRRGAAAAAAAAAASSSSSETADQQQQQLQQQQHLRQKHAQEPKEPRQPKPKQPTRKELAAAAAAVAAAQQQQVQQQVDRLLQMQQLIATSERTVRDLQLNLQAFENNPQAHQIASNTMQQAQLHLGTLRAQVQNLHQTLQQQGVVWDRSTGRVTHIPGLEINSSSSSSSKSSGDGGSKAGAKKGSSASKSSSSSKNGSSIPDVVVRSSRRDKRDAESVTAAAPADGTVHSPRRQSAAAPAASSSDSRHESSSSSSSNNNGATWKMVPSDLTVNGLNGKQHANGYNGHGSSSEADGSTYVAVKVEKALFADEDEL